MPQRKLQPALAALVFDLAGSPAAEIQLLPAGEFRARDGRPGDDLAWRLDNTIAARVIERFGTRRNPAVIDYEHQTLYASFKDGAAPAAGWFDGLRFDAATGLWATGVQWTARARAMIEAGEYRYISAVFSYLPDSGEILEIHHAGLTNDPALDGMAEVFQHRAAARFLPTPHPQEDAVDRKELCKQLGLAEDASDDQVQAAIAAARQASEQLQALRQELQLDEQADLKQAVASLRQTTPSDPGQPDPAKYVPVSVVDDLRQQVAALSQAQTATELDAVLKAAVEEGRISTDQAEHDWAKYFAKRYGVAALRETLEQLPPIAALKGSQTGGKAPGEGGQGGGGPSGKLTDSQRAMCRAMGVSEEEYAKTLAVEEA